MLTASAVAAERPPNFVVIFVDDMGYGDIEPFGSTINQTPNLSRMAKEGMKLTSFYSAAPLCSPSRAALMTGCYPKRVGLEKGSQHPVIFPGDPIGLHAEEVTLPQMLRSAGYRTGCFGKWHLGDQPEFLPTKRGFDVYAGIPYSNDMWASNPKRDFPKLAIMEQDKVVGEVKTLDDQADMCRHSTDAAVKFIRDSRDKPFFCYVPYAFIHHPRNARPQFTKKTKNPDAASGGVIEEIDWGVGEILKTIRELKLDKNTLVVFTSDNGGARGSVNRPLRGGKGSTWEGGMREPALVWWPGTIPAGTTSDHLCTTMDLLPTFAALVGTGIPNKRTIDGTSDQSSRTNRLPRRRTRRSTTGTAPDSKPFVPANGNSVKTLSTTSRQTLAKQRTCPRSTRRSSPG